MAKSEQLAGKATSPIGMDPTRTPVCRPQLSRDYHERMEAFQDAFVIDQKETKGKRLLLFDDLYRSGATVRTIAEALLKEGGAKSVHLLTLTKKASG